ncbi:MAG: alpha/beta hydrolase family protein [Armatimonadota bacterium]
MLSLAYPFHSSLQGPSPLIGDWQGKLNTGAISLRLVFHIKAEASGTLSATMDSPDQSAYGLPVGDVTLDGKSVKLVLPAVNGTLSGTLNDTGTVITGRWEQGGASLPITLTFSETPILPVKRPQTPEAPFPYVETSVTFPSLTKGVTLAGTLTVPKGPGPFPTAIFVSGSGGQDRDETLLGHKPFHVLADQLARLGIASLRYDDRGVGLSTGDQGTGSSKDFADDAEGAVRFLKTTANVKRNKIGFVGHSEGGLIAPMVAARNPDVAFVVMLAGPGVPGKDVILKQSEAIMKTMKASPADIKKSRDSQLRIIAAVEGVIRKNPSNPDPKQLAAALKKETDALIASLSPADKAEAQKNRAMVDAQVQQYATPWFRYFLSYDPRTALRKVKVPVLVMNGEKDVQVIASQNVPEVEKALRAGGNQRVTVRLMPGLNHLFQHAVTGSPQEYGTIDETFAPEAIKEITAFIRSVNRLK